MKRSIIALATIAVLALATVASGAQSNWTCGPGESVQAQVVPGGLELTFVPSAAYRVKFRAAEDLAGHGPFYESVEGATAGFVWAPPLGHPVVQALAKEHWTQAVPYPSSGCPTEKLIALN